MATQKFSKSEAIRFGWNIMRSNLGFFIGLLIVVGLICFVPAIISEVLKEDAPILSIIISIASWILDMIIQMGLIKLPLDSVMVRKVNLPIFSLAFPCFSSICSVQFFIG